MKRSLLTLFTTFIICGIQAQTQAQAVNLPIIGAMTIIPQSPTANDHIKIVTHVTTPNQSIIVDLSHTVTSNPNEIRLKGCYWEGMLTAIDEFVDTFNIGKLPGGTYSIIHKAYLSSGQQVCHKIDSNMVVTTFSVAHLNLVGIAETNRPTELGLFPNPVDNLLHFTNDRGYTHAAILSAEGRLIRKEELDLSSEIDVRDLPPGLYFIRFSDKERSVYARFIKNSGN